MADFEVSGQNYKSKAMPAITQFHVMRRLTPVIASFKDLIPLIKAGGGKIDIATVNLSALIEPAAAALAGMSDADTEFVINACMMVCERQQGAAWSPIWSEGAKRSRFDDIQMTEMLQIVAAVLLDAFSSFGPSLARGSSVEAQA